MTPREFYAKKQAEITEAEVRKVARVMTDHIGEENAVRLEEISSRAHLGERQTRDVLEILVKDYGFPIGAHAGKAGRWLIASEDERGHVTRELLSREISIRDRRRAIEKAVLPTSEDYGYEQLSLLDEGEYQISSSSNWWYQYGS